MSEYTSDTYSYRSATSLAEVASAARVPLAAATATTLTSVFARREAERQEQEGLPVLDANLRALETAPLLNATVTHLADGDLKDWLAKGNGIADLDGLVSRAEGRLYAAEGITLQRHLTESLAEIGYQVQEPRGPDREQPLLRGIGKDRTAVVVRLTPRAGRVELDLSGFQGDACTKVRRQLDAALRRRGVVLQTGSRHQHRALAGAALTRDAEARIGPAPAPARPQVLSTHTGKLRQ
jgi:hypothetical protein